MARVKDRFDALKREPGRVGSHRGPIRRGGGWLGLALFLVGLVVITTVGLFVVDRVVRETNPNGQGLDFNFPFLPEIVPTPTPTKTEAPPVVTDPAEATARGVKIMVINGTPLVDLQNAVGDWLAAMGWPVGSRVTAGDRDVPDTIIYYTDPANADVARGLSQSIGLGEVKPISPDVYPGQSIIFVVGVDSPWIAPAPVADPTAPAG